MATHTFYAYVDGYDLEEIVPSLEPEFDAFVSRRQWKVSGMKVVNQREKLRAKEGDLPRWDFGLNFELPDEPKRDPKWFEDLEEVAVFLRAMSAMIGREFVGGACEVSTGYTHDLFFIDGGPIPIERLRKAFHLEPQK